jgi:hypothetical protein
MLRIVFHAMSLQQGNQLIFETHTLMMRFLIFNISDHRRHQGRADAEGGIAWLPREFRFELARPA